MKISKQWLYEWVNPILDTRILTEQLTLAGLEVEAIYPVADVFTQVVVGQVNHVKPHPDPKVTRLRLCEVNVGHTLLPIVCGASNVREGLKVAVACIGATLANNNLTIKETKLRGVPSHGMLCSASELGLVKESIGILELPLDAPLGKDIREYMQFDDQIIDIHVTPNRGDCLSVRGLARELAALTNTPFIDKFVPKQKNDITDKLAISIHSFKDCPYYCARIIRDINQHAQTPIWIIERLRRSGFRSIHPVVDVTNYVLLEMGQPLHAFDLSKLDKEIIVRRAKKDERLLLLDGKDVLLDSNTLVIADKKQVQAIAGIMGGFNSSVSAQTTDIFLESAFFTPSALAGRARYFSLNSESAYRFERGVDSNLALQAIERATELLISIVGGKKGPLIVERKKTSIKPSAIQLYQSHIEKLLGIKLVKDDIESILRRLGMTFTSFCNDEKVWKVTPPSWRFDLHKEADLIEELARVYGYHNIPSSPVRLSNLLVKSCAEKAFPLKRLRQLLVDRDYHEAITYSFTSPQLQQIIDPEQTPLALVNPISSELSVMRSSLWPGLLNAVRYNQKRQQSRIRLFETGICFQNNQDGLNQNLSLAGVVTGDSKIEQWGWKKKSVDFFEVKSDIESLLSLTGLLSSTQFISGSHPALHPGQSAELVQYGKSMGYLGALNPKLLVTLDLIGPIYLFELALPSLMQTKLSSFKYFSKFPMVRRDLSFWIDEKFSLDSILEQVKINAGDCLNDSYLFDIYYDKQKKQGRRSLALALLWQHPSRTLIDSEVDILFKKVIHSLQQKFSIQLRE